MNKALFLTLAVWLTFAVGATGQAGDKTFPRMEVVTGVNAQPEVGVRFILTEIGPNRLVVSITFERGVDKHAIIFESTGAIGNHTLDEFGVDISRAAAGRVRVTLHTPGTPAGLSSVIVNEASLEPFFTFDWS